MGCTCSWWKSIAFAMDWFVASHSLPTTPCKQKSSWGQPAQITLQHAGIFVGCHLCWKVLQSSVLCNKFRSPDGQKLAAHVLRLCSPSIFRAASSHVPDIAGVLQASCVSSAAPTLMHRAVEHSISGNELPSSLALENWFCCSCTDALESLDTHS